MCVCLGEGGGGALKENLVELCSRSLQTLIMTKIVHFAPGGGGGGTLHMKGVGMLLEIETHLGVAQAFADP